jgi:mannose-6-phosphate isomerase-like protein (cupin superfamily)
MEKTELNSNFHKEGLKDNAHFVPKGWGSERWIVNRDDYCGKLLFMEQGKKLSWHFHKNKTETFYIAKGSVILYYGYSDDMKESISQELSAGEIFHVPTGLRHRLFALEDSEIIEFSTHHEDSDSIRVEKGD